MKPRRGWGFALEMLDPDTVKAYAGFALHQLNAESRMPRRWPCYGKACNGVVRYLGRFKFAKRDGRVVEVKRKLCPMHALKFSREFGVIYPEAPPPRSLFLDPPRLTPSAVERAARAAMLPGIGLDAQAERVARAVRGVLEAELTRVDVAHEVRTRLLSIFSP